MPPKHWKQVHQDTIHGRTILTWCDGLDFYHNTKGSSTFTIVDPRKYCPVAPRGLKEVEQPIPDYVHTKLPRMWCWSGEKEAEELDYLRMRFLREAKIFEMFRYDMHPNICTYHGCVIQNGLIRGICMSKYKYTLQQAVDPNNLGKSGFRYGITGPRLENGRELYETTMMRGLQKLHSKGYAHCDLKPDNIMLRNDGSCVIIDFDSCVPIGTDIYRDRVLVGRTKGWHDPRETLMNEDVDLDAVDEIKEWLSDKKPHQKRWLFGM